MTIRRRVFVPTIVILTGMVIGGCSDDEPTRPSAVSTSSTTSTTASAEEQGYFDCPDRPRGSSPARFDSAGGTYAAAALALGDGDLTFDIVQWLSGDEANAAYERETGDTSGVPNDYYVVNESTQLRTAPFDDKVTVYVLREDGGARLEESTIAGLRARLEESNQEIFWLTFREAEITAVCQQYRP